MCDISDNIQYILNTFLWRTRVLADFFPERYKLVKALCNAWMLHKEVDDLIVTLNFDFKITFMEKLLSKNFKV